MTNKAFKEGLAIFSATFSAVKLDTKTHKVWFMLLKDLTDEQFVYAVTKICREQTKFYPSDNFAALVREQLVVDTDNDAVLAWAAVKRAMSVKGSYCSVQFSDPVIHSVVRLMATGWAEFCHMPMDKWMQKEFVNNYKILATRDKHPEYLKGIIEIENTTNGYMDHIGKPVLIETGTGKHKVLEGHGERNIKKLAETAAKQLSG